MFAKVLRAGALSCSSWCVHNVVQSALLWRKFYILGIVPHARDEEVTFSEFKIRPGLVKMAEIQTHNCYLRNSWYNTGTHKILSIGSIKFSIFQMTQGKQQKQYMETASTLI